MLRPSPKTYQDYKSKSPEETLQWIQDLLRPYFPPYISLGLLPNEFGSTWFCRLSLINPEIGQNGKGITISLALASGFAEFMERLQALYMMRNFSNNFPRLMMLPNTLSNNESITQWKKFNSTIRKEMNDRIPNIAITESIKSTFYRFYNVLNGNKPVYLDRSLAFTPFLTTGIAAGNTREEATVHALCELFERYAARKIIESRTVVPSIPWSLLSERTQSMLHEIQNAGFDVYIKDFSRGIGLPVVCVVIGTPELGYHARPGCATDISVAIERCILEFYQGIPSTKDKISSVRILTERWKELYSILSDYLKSYFALDEFIIVNFLSAYDFPPDNLEFLTKDSSESFTPWNYFSTDFYKEVQLLLELCKKNRFRVYMRDIGWMGFPTVQILSPELKKHEFDSIERRVFNSEELKQFQRLLLQGVDSIRTRQFYELLHTLEILYFCMILNPPRVDYLRGLIQEEPIRYINHWYFLGYVAYYFQDIKLAKCFFRCYNTFHPQDKYSTCLVRLMELLPENPWDENTTIREDILKISRNELCKTFSSTTVEEIINDFKAPMTVLDIFNEVIVPCEECENCSIIQRCSYGQIVPILKRLQNNFSELLQWEEKV